MRFSKGDNRDYAPVCPIWLLLIIRVKLVRLRRFAKGHNREYAPMSPI